MFDPAVWGPSFWRVFLLAAERMPLEQMRRLSELMGDLLPCVHCRASYAEYSRTLSPATSIRDRDSAILYVWTVKDLVNEKLGQGFLPQSKLRARMCALAQYASAADVMDVVAFAALGMDKDGDGRLQSYAAAAPLLCGLCALVDERPELAAPPCAVRSPLDARRHALACTNALNASRGIGVTCESAFLSRYDHARASDAPTASSRQKALVRSQAHTPRSSRRSGRR